MRRMFLFLLAVLLSAFAIAFLPGRKLTVEHSDAPLASRVLPSPQPTGEGEIDEGGRTPFGGLPCPSGNAIRPFAVMLAGDTVARPLSGLAAADLVVEMPVITDGINRFMAVVTCAPGEREDIELGSVRSARDDFLPLAAAFDAVYAHWGGSHFALDALKAHIIENIDALRNPANAYFRKRGIPAPHNGFTTIRRLLVAAAKLGYRTEAQRTFHPYPHLDTVPSPPSDAAARAVRITIGYPGPYRVSWEYDEATHRYRRSRGGTPERDGNTGAQVTASTIVVMRTLVRQIEGQYNDVRVQGSGAATVYRFGGMVAGRWEKAKDPLGAPLRFVDSDGQDIPFARGPVWIEIVASDTAVSSE